MTRATRRLTQMAVLCAKEWRLLLRNPHGLAVLFVMPGLFVLVMSFTLKNTLVTRVDLPASGVVLEDRGPVAARWASDWRAHSGAVTLASRDELRRALKAHRVEAGVIVRNPWFDANGRPRADQLELWLGNRVQPAAAARLRTELVASTLQLQLRIAAAEAGPFASVLVDEIANPQIGAAAPTIRYLNEIESGRTMTAVQQSVPAWLIFGMFFVVVPLAGVLIQERNDGTLTRLATFGVTPGAVLGGKLAAFMLLNWVQLVFMLLIGRWLVPLLGGDALYLDVDWGWFAVMVISTSMAAVGLALMIAARTRSFDHAAALGSGVNVILAAIAGVMVPRMLMPPALQRLSEMSPMGWALDGMQSVFLGEPDAAFILPRAAALLAFAAVCLLLAWVPLRRHDQGP